MEPLFFKAENRCSVRRNAGEVVASMEPLFFKAENLPSDFYVWSVELPLQWSRFFSKRKIIQSYYAPKSFSQRFNGAAFFQSGKLL